MKSRDSVLFEIILIHAAILPMMQIAVSATSYFSFFKLGHFTAIYKE